MPPATTPESSEVREKILAVGQRIMAAKGFSAVGLTEILTAADVPKGSFYHYFGSKDAFGEALLKSYFTAYLADMDQTLGQPGVPMAQRLDQYWDAWRDNQSFLDCQGKCLAVKLGAEVADLSEAMRLAMKEGTSAIIERLSAAIAAGVADGSLLTTDTPRLLAESLYQHWLGASVMAKIERTAEPFAAALATTHRILRPSP